MNQNIYSVGQVNQYIKNMFSQDYLLGRIQVKGEVSNCKYHTSGHIYFSLKDVTGQIACVMFAGHRRGLAFAMKDGDKVIVSGNINIYERDGRYQLYASSIELEGAGALYERYLALKKELEEMGMFATEYKQPIPKFAAQIGIVTAPTGAAIQDIRNVAGRRNPYAQLILYPALVQGDGAKDSIIRGIRMLDQAGVDVIIIGRGGGSIEDLWAFNEEEVARAIFDCHTPVISAVGHETDFTIADYVSDLRAPTPSAAAELATYDVMTLLQTMTSYRTSLTRLMSRKTADVRGKMEKYLIRLQYLSPSRQLQEKRQLAADLQERLHSLMETILMRQRERQENLAESLRDHMEDTLSRTQNRFALYLERFKGLSPLDKLKQGFSYVEDQTHHAVTSIGQVSTGEPLFVQVTDGTIYSTVTDRKGTKHG